MLNRIEKYAELLIRIGVNIQKDQTLVISSPVECADFARIAAKKAYEAGAREVVMKWFDEKSAKMRFNMANDEVFDEFPEWEIKCLNGYADKEAAFLSIISSDPELMKDVDPKKLARQNKISSISLEYYRSRRMSAKNAWCVAAIPEDSWAKKVFPKLSTKEAVDRLWDAIFKTMRVDREDPVQSWRNHLSNLQQKVDFLNNNAFKSLRYKNDIGTDVVVDLPDNHVWTYSGTKVPAGYEFILNMPTEEIATMPKDDGVNGKIVSSMPLSYNGKLIENFSFDFKDGRVVDYDAKKGKEILKELLDTDKGAKRLGEVALVPYDSPISNQNILFYNTLFDENASCHFALGKAYPVCIKGGGEMSKDELKAAGVNDSLIHVDFMVGTKDLEIIGIREDGSEEKIFINENFA